ncbi:hypothetical protein MKX03_033799 [Papaver bracteatum]|nr:hypothetical protein MKX03_033799 [Papaver bracteatum]
MRPFTPGVNPLDQRFDHLFKKDVPKVKPEDCIEYAAKYGAPPKKYVWIDDILVPEVFRDVYRRTKCTKGPIFTPTTRFPEELKNDPDALFKFKVRTLGSILWAVYTTHYPTFSSPMIEKCLQRVEKVIADGEAIQCNPRLMDDLRFLLDRVMKHYRLTLEFGMDRQAEEEAVRT